jgi:hypothetical protein
VGDDIEERLAAATAQLRQYQIAMSHLAELRDRQRYIEAQIAELRAAHALEERDVERLEGLSLTRILHSLRGSREDVMAREQAEADAARYKVAEAEARLDAVRREYGTVRARLDSLASAQHTYDTLLEEKERYLAESTDPRGRRLLVLAEERGRLTDEVRELAEAIEAAQTARQALDQLSRTLNSASGWSTYDTFFGGGMISSAIKHSRLDEAAKEAEYADRCLMVLRTELADLGGTPQAGWSIPVDGLTRFVDVWFDNVFTDLAVRERIRTATDNVGTCLRRVRNLIGDLGRRTDHAHNRLTAIDKERLGILNAPTT